MKVSALGEFGLIGLIHQTVERLKVAQPPPPGELLLGIGDDAAAWRPGQGVELATTDTLVQGVHFTIGFGSWVDLGWKALAVNISDLAAMGGLSRYCLVTLGLPPDAEVEWITDLYQGMAEAARQYDVGIVGGDIVRSPVVFVTVALMGPAPEGKLLTRSAARPGDQIAVTGYVGSSAAGLRMMQKHLVLEERAVGYLRQAHLRPQPRVAEGRLLVAQGVKSAIDISDGLLGDLAHICEASGVGARLYLEKVPSHPWVQAAFGDEALRLALSGGEDYELLFTAPAEMVRAVQEAASLLITVLGEITPEPRGRVVLVDAEGQEVSPQELGWDHLKR
ncbi:MAG: thiamine-phosphate kinase [Chloroflexi bacterium]|nr:thiamine-phosphate kinase [Chloroflexota bacterium]